MSLALVGLGLTGDLTSRGREVLESADEVYAEFYTSVLPPKARARIEEEFGPTVLERERVESSFLVKRAAELDVVFLVVGDPLFATTHQVLLFEARRAGIDAEVVHNTSVFSAVGRTGLSLYNFGRIATISFWRENFKPTRPVDVLMSNQSVGAHTLLLADISEQGPMPMDVREALKTLEMMLKAKGVEFSGTLLACSRLCWPDERILAFSWEERERVMALDLPGPACLIVPGKLSLVEEEFCLSSWRLRISESADF